MSNFFLFLSSHLAIVISVSTAIVALSHLLWFVFFRFSDMKKWKILNNPNIIIDDVYALAWGKITHEQLNNTNWGYDVRTSAIIKDKTYTGDYRILESLALMDEKKEELQTTQRFLTVQDLEKYVKHQQLNPPDYSIRKDMSFQIKFKNIGFTPASNLSIKFQWYNPSSDGWEY